MKFAKLKSAKVLKKNQMDKLFGGNLIIECTMHCANGCVPSCKPGQKYVIL